MTKLEALQFIVHQTIHTIPHTFLEVVIVKLVPAQPVTIGTYPAEVSHWFRTIKPDEAHVGNRRMFFCAQLTRVRNPNIH
jgi:hypothetical protein